MPIKTETIRKGKDEIDVRAIEEIQLINLNGCIKFYIADVCWAVDTANLRITVTLSIHGNIVASAILDATNASATLKGDIGVAYAEVDLRADFQNHRLISTGRACVRIPIFGDQCLVWTGIVIIQW